MANIPLRMIVFISMWQEDALIKKFLCKFLFKILIMMYGRVLTIRLCRKLLTIAFHSMSFMAKLQLCLLTINILCVLFFALLFPSIPEVTNCLIKS